MKKIFTAILFIAANLLILSPFIFANTLWEYYRGQIPSIYERAKIWNKNLSSLKYEGSYNQNIELLDYIENQKPKGGIAGGVSAPNLLRKSGNNISLISNNWAFTVGTTTATTSSSNYANFNLWGQGTTSGQTFEITNAASTTLMMVLDNGNVGIGVKKPLTSLNVAATSSNATSTLTVGKTGQNKGTCLELFDAGGTVVYAYVATGATAFTLSSSSCK